VTHVPFRDACFDAVVCFGSVLSHVGARAEEAARELVRTLRRDGTLLLSVQSARNYYLPDILGRVAALGLSAVDEDIMQDRELREVSGITDVVGVTWRQFSHEQLESLAKQIGCDVRLISASNVLATVANIPLLQEMENDEALWQAFLRWEEHLGRMRGNTEHGAHTIAVLRKR
jgi:hypothetical protein